MSELVQDVRPAPTVANRVRARGSQKVQRLSVGTANDQAEREADRVADEVVRDLAGRAGERTRGLFTSATTRIRPASAPTDATSPINIATNATPVIRRDWRLAKVKDWHAELNQSPLGKKYRGETSIHHHISQLTMGDVASSYEEAATSGGPLKLAAGRFKSAVWQVLQKSGVDLPKTVEKALHNLPFNLHYGPTRVSGNPGFAFDPTTEPGRNGPRADTAMTALLRRFETSYRAEATRNLGLTVGVWDDLTEMLGNAQALWEKSGAELETSAEQWMLIDEDDNVWTKKGLLSLKDYPTCLNRFNKQDTYYGPETGGAVGNLVGHYVHALDFDDGSSIELALYFDDERLDHFCNRHTFRYFDFNIKGVNVFWPTGTDRANLSQRVSNRLNDIALDIARDAQFDAAEDDVQAFEGRLGTTLGGKGFKQTTADGAAYYAANEVGVAPVIPGVAANDVHYVHIEMFAPSGSGFEAFEQHVLKEMIRDVDRNSQR